MKRCWVAVVLAMSWLGVQAQEDAGLVQTYMDFLYRYMPLPDQTDYSLEFYEHNVRQALQARRQMPWGGAVPEREFRHFVLPVRVNNETLDSCRWAIYPELSRRVAGLSMADAILEVNHWCHEHVTYRPSDARTSSPLATIRTAYGRCGEESTLLVAALRAVGIPARQVYTPRWAHTDDNHAWVEAWADGQWYFLGACEPEPVLNLGWFNESASRGMLMHTRVFGHYDGPEEVMSRNACYTEINVTSNYAPTSLLRVRVVDAAGRPVSGATVEFKLYNYAEFYTMAAKITDADGYAQLTAGRGDMLLWVYQGTDVGSAPSTPQLRKVSFGKDAEVTVVLNDQPLPPTLDLDMVPPPASAQLPVVTPQQRADNNRRLALEDSIRRAYEQTMPVEAWRGNHETISRFLAQAKNPDMARRLLDVLSDKDLRDVTLDVLLDNDVATTDTSALYGRYVLCPRVEDEWLTPYKTFFRHHLSHIHDVRQLVAWCADSLRIDGDHNPRQLRMQPMSTWRHRVTDPLGRNIFFVSAARSLGFPARINEVNQKPQYYADGQWYDALFDISLSTGLSAQPAAKGQLSTLHLASSRDAKYYVHFTLSRLANGRAQLLTYPEDATWQRDFSQGVELEAGQYLLTTGTRLASGKVLAHLQTFNLTAPQTTQALTLRDDTEEPQVIGSLNAENLYHDLATAAPRSLLSTTGRGYYVLGIVAPNHEPTNHALRDISACASQLEAWGRSMVLLLPSADDARRFNFQEFQQLPSTVVWGIDTDSRILSEACAELRFTSASLPLFLICDSFNRVVYAQQGYTIHLGEQLLKVISRL